MLPLHYRWLALTCRRQGDSNRHYPLSWPGRTRTYGIRLNRTALCQLSYWPLARQCASTGVESKHQGRACCGSWGRTNIAGARTRCPAIERSRMDPRYTRERGVKLEYASTPMEGGRLPGRVSRREGGTRTPSTDFGDRPLDQLTDFPTTADLRSLPAPGRSRAYARRLPTDMPSLCYVIILPGMPRFGKPHPWNPRPSLPGPRGTARP